MKMNYLGKNKTKKVHGLFTKIIFFVVLIFVILQIFAPHFIPAFFTSIVAPFWRAEFVVQSGGLKTSASLLNENEALRREIENNMTRMEIVDFIENENADLRSILGDTSSTSVILAPIIKRPPFFAYDEFIIDAGLDKNISTSSIVFSVGNIPIGKVVSVQNKTSKVILFSSPGEKTEILIGQKNIPAVAVGRGGGQYEAQLPQGIDVGEGDYIILAENDFKPIGKVVSVDSSSIFQKINFALPTNIYQMRWVLIEK